MEEIEKRARAIKEQIEERGRTIKAYTSGTDTLSVDRADEQSTGTSDKKTRATSKSVRAHTNRTRGNTNETGADGQQSQNILERKRESTGGSSNDNTSTPESDHTTGDGRRRITIERLDEVPVRDFDYVPPEEEEPTNEEKNTEYFKEQVHRARGFFKGRQRKEKSKPLNEKEAKHYEEVLPDLIISYGEYADKGIAWYSKQDIDEMGDIWGDLSNEEANCITRILIKRGKRNGVTADFVRNLEEGYDYIALGVIIVPRMMKTSEEIKKSPRKSVRLHDRRNRR